REKPTDAAGVEVPDLLQVQEHLAVEPRRPEQVFQRFVIVGGAGDRAFTTDADHVAFVGDDTEVHGKLFAGRLIVRRVVEQPSSGSTSRFNAGGWITFRAAGNARKQDGGWVGWRGSPCVGGRRLQPAVGWE